MVKLKLIIAGSRDITNIKLLYHFLNKSKLKQSDVAEIVSGGARGVDRLGEIIAKRYHIPVKLFPADWDTYGRSAGYRRNAEMAKYGDVLVAIRLNTSKGTTHMIKLMEHKPTYILEL